MDAPHPFKRLLSFWPLQSLGWFCYAAATVVAYFPLRQMRDQVAYRTTFLSTAFLSSFLLYALCHALRTRRVAIGRMVLSCVAASYILGVLCEAPALLAEQHFAPVPEPVLWTAPFAYGVGASFTFIAYSAIYLAIKMYQDDEERRIRLLKAEATARAAQLQALQYQLQPHFLYNTLNAISTLVVSLKNDAAVEMIARLGDLLRSTLRPTETYTVALEEELATAAEYLAIEKVRFGCRLSFSFDVPSGTELAQVPRFLLQPLLENAIRHGVAARPEGGAILIHVRQEATRLNIAVESDVAASQIEQRSEGFGVGLKNTRARLDALFGDQATLTASSPNGERFIASIEIPFLKDSVIPAEVQLR